MMDSVSAGSGHEGWAQIRVTLTFLESAKVERWRKEIKPGKCINIGNREVTSLFYILAIVGQCLYFSECPLS